jgi:hypothetical protein
MPEPKMTIDLSLDFKVTDDENVQLKRLIETLGVDMSALVDVGCNHILQKVCNLPSTGSQLYRFHGIDHKSVVHMLLENDNNCEVHYSVYDNAPTVPGIPTGVLLKHGFHLISFVLWEGSTAFDLELTPISGERTPCFVTATVWATRTEEVQA